ncbi:MAG: ATP-dependent helicase [Candidatus Taylorbacteria bacterium]|nr:ATP-dependent helicase [Candidatus Taylorbacteria bacterium]
MNVPSSEKFKELHGKLNKEQKLAVDTIDGPVMVIAGPGTGKTSILTLRIANILQRTDTPAECILALTFTESGAYNMRRKLVEIVGSVGYKVNISTFHGFCNANIKEYPERFPRIIGSTAMTDIDQIKTMGRVIADTELEFLKPYGDPLYYVRPALNAIKSMKREGYGTEELKQSIEQQEKTFLATADLYHEKGAHKGKMKGEYIKEKEHIEKNKELLKIFEGYEAMLAKKKQYDYEDMIVEVIKVLRAEPEFLLILQENYQYILADEHQDANNAQNAILELLSNFHPNPNLFIVGDEKQAIFRFQGASLENFLYFKKMYPKALLINLQDNYRSQQGILDASHSLIEKNVAPEAFPRLQLKSNSKYKSAAIRVHEFHTEDVEHFFIATDIKNKIASGTKPEDIVVLYRDNRDAFPIAATLERLGVACKILSDQDMLRDPHIRKLILIFRGLANLADNEALSKLLFVDFLGLKTLEVFKIFQKAKDERKSLQDVLQAESPEFFKKLVQWASLGQNKPFAEVFESVVRESGFLADALKSDQSLERLRILEVFFGEIRKLGTGVKEYFLSDFVEYLNLLDDHGLLLKSSGGGDFSKGVRLMTAHKSKGLEFEHVYIAGCFDGHWGNKKDRKYFHIGLLGGDDNGGGKIEDERRLFYVALTRAKQTVSISYAVEGREGREQLPSQFIEEITPVLKEVADASAVEKAYAAMPAFNFTEKVLPKVSIADREYVKNLFLERGMSVTDLNNYLACPWQYFFVNLIRLPQSQTKHQIYGTVVHETLQSFFNKYREEADMSRKEFLELFEYNLGRKPLSSADYKELQLKGLKSLGGYYDTYKNMWPREVITEYAIRGVHLPVTIGNETQDILLKGKLDKVEILENERSVNVVDYKTGKAKSRNELDGKTKNADGNYKRQLVFYKLLLSLDEAKRYEMQSGELDFTESDEKMRYKKERFEISSEEVCELKQTISRVAGEIMNLEFWTKTCEIKDCDWCRLRQLLD